MRIIYAGYNRGSSLDRFNALQLLNPDILFFSVDPYISSGRKWRDRIERLTFYGPHYRRLNQDLIEFCGQHRPEMVWVDKGFWIRPSTLRSLKGQGAFLVHHFTDAYFPRRLRPYWEFALLRKALPLFDMNFTSNVFDHEWLVRQGLRAELTYLGYNHTIFDNQSLPPEVARKWASDLLFIGHHERRTEKYIWALIEAGLGVQVYGANWHNARHKSKLRGHVHFRTLSDPDYVAAMKTTRIGLCFFSEVNYNLTAGRSFEIAACETFLLAMRSIQHLECYEEGREAEFFDNPEEMVRKARYYLEHEEERRQIARRGYERCMRSDYSWERYMREDFPKVLQAMKQAPISQAV